MSIYMSKGFLVYANGELYLHQAYVLALSLKRTNNKFPISIVTDNNVPNHIKKVFDNIITVPWKDQEDDSRYQIFSRWKLYHCTPYEETVVLDSDLLVLENIDHWWEFLGKYYLYFPTKAYTYRGDIVTSNYYRKQFDNNNLPNIYSTIFYFKKNDISHQFFKWVEIVNNNWQLFYGSFCKNNYPKNPSMDLTHAIVSKILNIDNVITNKLEKTIFFTHMKPMIQDWKYPEEDWQFKIGTYLTRDLRLLIGNYLQKGIFHYASNNFINDDIIKKYESA